ncbi:unnamed protein product [Leptidea sinapis]|uniref:Uncharacterized protein n=1 Tax=Leptidea sinapis TaxID=189913 RepID=A0A5E4QQM2_9NEOP|nr:unnamed protein product [Leptidea sinapis]
MHKIKEQKNIKDLYEHKISIEGNLPFKIKFIDTVKREKWEDDKTQYALIKPLQSSELFEIAVELFKIMLDFGVPEVISTTEQNRTNIELAAKLVRKMVITNTQQIEICGKKKLKCFNILENVTEFIAFWTKNSSMKNWATLLSYVQWIINTNGSVTLTQTNSMASHNSNSVKNKMPFEAEFGILLAFHREQYIAIETDNRCKAQKLLVVHRIDNYLVINEA